MEAQPQSGSSSSSAAYPRWVMLEQYLEIKVEDSSCSPTDDANTLATALTSAGHPIQVSLRLAEPPALSRVFLRIPDGLEEEKSKVLAAHGDSLLIQVRIKEKNQPYHTAEHFVYNAGAHAAEHPRPPSLWLLPPYYFSGSGLVPRELFYGCTGLLRRGEDDLVVAQLMGPSVSKDAPRVVAELMGPSVSKDAPRVVAELMGPSDSRDAPRVARLYLFRSGEWKYYHFKAKEAWDLPLIMWDTVIPVDDRLLCWVHLPCGVMLLDVFKETPTVQYVRLPMDPRDCRGGLNRNVCTTAGGGTLKFVNISCDCEHSLHAYTIHTWTMKIADGDMEWVKDGMVDATELWALDAYSGLPRNPLDCPIVSIDEPNFRMRDTKNHSWRWQILVNMRSKTIHSVSHYEEDLGYKLIPSKVSYFFNACPSSGRRDDATLTGQSQIDNARSSTVVADEPPTGDGDASNPTMQASEILEAFQEIPSYGLGPDEVKAYRILSSNNGRRLRSLLRLPKSLRKNWLLIEIKASQD